jgi:hypothetical protein
MTKPPREWFAVKRTKDSGYHFYAPNENNRETIESIAPDRGNFEEVTLIEKSAYTALETELTSYKKHLKLFEESIRHSFKEREDALEAKLEKAVAALETVDKVDRERGYPTGPEWILLLKIVNETLKELKK